MAYEFGAGPLYQPGGAQTSYGGAGGNLLGGIGSAAAGGPWGLAAYGGLQALGGLASWLGGRGREKEAKKRYLADRQGLLSLLGQSAFKPQDIAFSARTKALQGVGRQANLVNRRLGLDTGAAQTDILRGLATRNQGLLADLMMQNALTKYNRDFGIRRTLLGSSANYAGA